MKIEYYNPEELKQHKDNPREISPHAFSGLCESLKKFGFQQPAIINKDLEVISGNQRTKAAISIGMKKIPCLKLDLTDSEQKALMITLNNSAIGGDFTEGIKNLLSEIKTDLGDDYVFDLNLDDVLSNIPSFEEDEGQVEDESEPEEASLRPTVIRMIINDLDEYPEVLNQLKSLAANFKGVTIN